jgi:hypothetical protein
LPGVRGFADVGTARTLRLAGESAQCHLLFPESQILRK